MHVFLFCATGALKKRKRYRWKQKNINNGLRQVNDNVGRDAGQQQIVPESGFRDNRTIFVAALGIRSWPCHASESFSGNGPTRQLTVPGPPKS